MTKYKDHAYFLTIILTHQDAKANCALIEACGTITVAPSTQVRKAIVREDWLPRNSGDQERHTSNLEAAILEQHKRGLSIAWELLYYTFYSQAFTKVADSKHHRY